MESALHDCVTLHSLEVAIMTRPVVLVPHIIARGVLKALS